MKTQVNNAFVMSATAEQLAALAEFVGMSGAQVAKAVRLNKLAQVIGTKLANSPEHNAAFAANELTIDLPEAPQPEPQAQPQAQAQPGKRAATKSAKDWLRDLLSAENAEFTLAELIALSGKTEVNIRTMLSDLRSPKYCGKGGVFATKSVRKDQKVYYSKA
jgi:hypothetical protein